MKTFNEQVYDIIQEIPLGRVVTYGQIAGMIGKPRAARFVGFAMNNPKMEHLPWHRVTFADGHLCPGWADIQYNILKAEGVTFTKDRMINIKKHQWNTEETIRPVALQDFPLVF